MSQDIRMLDLTYRVHYIGEEGGNITPVSKMNIIGSKNKYIVPKISKNHSAILSKGKILKNRYIPGGPIPAPSYYV